MRDTNRRRVRWQFDLERLKDRCVPVMWPVNIPIGQTGQVVGTYAQ
jgi:hypothetical protein